MPSYTTSANQGSRCSSSPGVRPSSCFCSRTSDTWGKIYCRVHRETVRGTSKFTPLYMSDMFVSLSLLWSYKGMDHLYSMKCKNKVPLYDLLLEMLDAHRLRPLNKVPRNWADRVSSLPTTTAPTTTTTTTTHHHNHHSCVSTCPADLQSNPLHPDQRPSPWKHGWFQGWSSIQSGPLNGKVFYVMISLTWFLSLRLDPCSSFSWIGLMKVWHNAMTHFFSIL